MASKRPLLVCGLIVVALVTMAAVDAALYTPDVTKDGKVDIFDLASVGLAYGTQADFGGGASGGGGVGR
jgi:hypothetical protein